MKIENSVVSGVFNLHPEFHSHPVPCWAMAKVGVHPALVVPKGPHPGQRRVGTSSASLCTGEADAALANFMNRERIERGIHRCAIRVLERHGSGSKREAKLGVQAGTPKNVADYWVSHVSKSCHGQCTPLRRAK